METHTFVILSNLSLQEDFSLETIQEKKEKEYGYVSMDMQNHLFPQRIIVPDKKVIIEMPSFINSRSKSYSQWVEEYTSPNDDLLMRKFDSLLSKETDLLSCYRDIEIIIPIFSKSDETRERSVPILVYLYGKWNWLCRNCTWISSRPAIHIATIKDIF